MNDGGGRPGTSEPRRDDIPKIVTPSSLNSQSEGGGGSQVDAAQTLNAKELIRARLEAIEKILLGNLSTENKEYFHGKQDAYESALRDIEFCHEHNEHIQSA